MSTKIEPTGPDLLAGISITDIADGGMLQGQANGDAILLVRRGDEVFALDAGCGHYGAPLIDGIVVGHEVRCPWHHACFDIRTGAAVGPPSPRAIASYAVIRDGDRVRLGDKKPALRVNVSAEPGAMVIVGGGAAGDAAADTMRSEGYGGKITIVMRDDESLPIDRPNLSKDYLAGTAPEYWLPVRNADFYVEHKIELKHAEVLRIDTGARRVELTGGQSLAYDKLLLATGSSAIRLDLPGASLPHVFVMRTLPDSRGVLARVKDAKQAVIIGASFIGLEAAASLIARGLKVHVVAPETRPLERILGPEVGDFVRGLHEEHGVVFHLGRKPAAISESEVTLDDGSKIAADLVVMGVGVRPQTALAEAAGLTVERGVVVDAFLQTSAPHVYAAGDIARYPAGAGTWRVEHWVAAQRQGQIAARNMLGKKTPMLAVPFFWSQHYDVPVNYVGHAERWDRIAVAGSLKDKNAFVSYWLDSKIIAAATVYRDKECLLAGEALANDDQAALAALAG